MRGMQWSERFVAGRLRRRLLRAPAIDGWTADDIGQAAVARAQMPLTRVEGGLAFKIPDSGDLLQFGETASELLAEGECELLVGWPERIVIVRREGQVLYADGDVVHFGPLALDPDHTIERTGYEYVNDTDAEVRVELTVHAAGDERVAMLDPGDTLDVGPFRIEHQRSFDPSDRPGGARHHGYAFVVRRTAALSRPRPSDVPHPLDLEEPAAVLALARHHGFLGDDEAALGETAAFHALAQRYEGPRQTLETELRDTGPDPAELRRPGESVQVVSPGLWRGDHGDACYGRLSVTVGPAGEIAISKSALGTMPGRLRKQH